MTCPYKFYYKAKLDKNAYTTEKVCLKKDEMCPSNLPFYYTSTNECVESCPLDLLFYQGCKISNPYFGINIFILIIKISFMQGYISQLSKSFSLYAFNNIMIKISIFNLPYLCNLCSYRNLNERKLGVNEDFEYYECKDLIYKYGDSLNFYKKDLEELSKQGFKAWLFSGTEDIVVSTLATSRWINSCNFTISSKWKPVINDGQVIGMEQSYTNGLTFITVKNAGHMVPIDQPKAAKFIFDKFLSSNY
jgi:hypothetical protein